MFEKDRAENTIEERNTETFSATLILSPVATLAQDQLKIGTNGLGNVTATTPFDAHVLAVIPDRNWRWDTQVTEDGTQEVIRAMANGVAAVTLFSNDLCN